jgi:hypothetical protein
MFDHDVNQRQHRGTPSASLLSAAYESEAALRRREALATLTAIGNSDPGRQTPPPERQWLSAATTLGGALLGAVAATALSRLDPQAGITLTDPLFAVLALGGGLAGLFAGRLLVSPRRAPSVTPTTDKHPNHDFEEIAQMHRDPRFMQPYQPAAVDPRHPAAWQQPTPVPQHSHAAYQPEMPQPVRWAGERAQPYYDPYASDQAPAYSAERRSDNDDRQFDDRTDAAIEEIRRMLRELREAIAELTYEREERRRYG